MPEGLATSLSADAVRVPMDDTTLGYALIAIIFVVIIAASYLLAKRLPPKERGALL